MVVNNRIQINFRRNASVSICRHVNCICITYMDGSCLIGNSVISCIKKFQNFIKQKL